MSWKAPITDRVFEDTVFARNNQGNSEHNKGALNYTDLNRIEDNYKYILERLGEEFYHIPHNSRNYTETVQTVIQPEIDENVYIQSSGTQYIDTGVNPTNNTRLILDVDVLPTNTSGTIQIASATNGTNYFVLRLSSNFTTYQARRGSDPLFAITHSGELYGRHLFDINKEVVSVDGIITNDIERTFSIDYPIFLCCQNNKGATAGLSKLKIYSCRIYDNDVLVRDFIPAKDSNDIVCLYDKVTQAYFYNQGTGEFTLGTEDGPLEYIESTGTQYIDTGFVPNQDTRVVMTLSDYMTGSSHQCAFSSRTSGSSSDNYNFYLMNAGYYRSDYAGTISNYDSSIFYNDKFTIDKNKNVTTLNGEHSVEATYTSFTGTYPIYLFAQNTAGTAAVFSSMKLHSCQIYDNDVLVRDFVPYCKDGTVCLYDKVNDSYFYNAGTGSFIGGGAIITTPEPEISVEKITYTDWQEINIPWKSEIDRIRRNHNNLASLFLIKYGYTEIEKNQYLNYEEVNKIEDIDLKGKEAYEKMTAEYIPCGTISCGGDLL